jgi:hypothetical protein
MSFRYQVVKVPDRISMTDEDYAKEGRKKPSSWDSCTGNTTMRNPSHRALVEGTFIPPQGSRVVSLSYYNGGDFALLLEFDNPDGHPYR